MQVAELVAAFQRVGLQLEETQKVFGDRHQASIEVFIPQVELHLKTNCRSVELI